MLRQKAIIGKYWVEDLNFSGKNRREYSVTMLMRAMFRVNAKFRVRAMLRVSARFRVRAMFRVRARFRVKARLCLG